MCRGGYRAVCGRSGVPSSHPSLGFSVFFLTLGGTHKRILQQSSQARFGARDWRTLALTQVHHKRKQAACCGCFFLSFCALPLFTGFCLLFPSLFENGLFSNPSRRLHGGTSRIDDSPPAPACAPRNSIQNRHLVRPLNRSWRGATAILHLCLTTSNSV